LKSLQAQLFAEKYRPQTIEETILPQHIKDRFLKFRESENIPNLLLSGPAGTGKTTIAKALLKELDYDYMVINGSDSADSGIDVLRTRIRAFASSVSLDGKRKFVIIDEADHLSPVVQPAMREFMEKFSSNCGFIMTCNYRNRIIDPLQSRMSLIEFYISKEDRPQVFKEFHKRVTDILDKEGVEYDSKIVAEFIVQHFPDFRKIINELQMHSVQGKIDKSILTAVREDVVGSLIEVMKKKNFNEMRKWVAENIDLGPENIFRKLYETLPKYLKSNFIPNMIIILADYQYKSVHVPDTELNMVACLTEVMADCEFRER